MRPNRTRKRMGYQNLESRKLLAADFGISMSSFEMNPQGAEAVQVFEIEFDQMDFDQMMMGVEAVNQQISPFAEASHVGGFPAEIVSSMEMPGSFFEMNVETGESRWMLAQEGDMLSEAMFGEAEFVESIETFGLEPWGSVSDFFVQAEEFDLGEGFMFEEIDFADWHFDSEYELDEMDSDGVEIDDLDGDFLDVSDGADGVFGVINADNSSPSYSFFATEDGQANVVLASTLTDGGLSVELVDSEGNVVEPASNSSDAGFSKWSFDIQQGEIYTLNLNADEGSSGDYQMTVTVEAAEPVDSHADEVGEAATQLEFTGGFAEGNSQLETDGDRDVFQFVALASEELVLHANDSSVDSDLNLSVTVYDADGEEVVSGKTNAGVSLEFATNEGETYFVAINAAEGQTGSYHFAVLSDSIFDMPVDVDDIDDAIDVDMDDVDGVEVEEGELDSDTEFEDVDDSGEVVGEEELDDDDDGVAVEDDEIDADTDVEVIEMDDSGEVVVGEEEIEGDGVAVEEGDFDADTDVEIVDMDASELTDEVELEGPFEFTFDTSAWDQLIEGLGGERSKETDSPAPAAMQEEVQQLSMALEGDLVPQLEKGQGIEDAVEIEVMEFDAMDLDEFFSANWFERQFNLV